MQGLSSLTPGHLSVGGGHLSWDQHTMAAAHCQLCTVRGGWEQSIVRGALVLGWAVQRRALWLAGGGAAGACNCDACRPPPSHAFQQRSSTGWYRSCPWYKLGCPISTPRASSSFSGTMSVKVDGWAQTAK